jgi:hypothetical protein
MENFRMGLFSAVGVSAKTGLVACHTEHVHQFYLKYNWIILGRGPV